MEWSKSLQQMPTLTINEIEEFFAKSGKTGKTQRRADSLLFDSFLDSISCSNDINFFYVKAVCSASYTKGQYHQLSCSFSHAKAKVNYAYCTCKAGKGGFCNHIYALFKLLAQFVLDKLNEVPPQLPCTSRPCGWTVPKVRKMGVKKETVMETIIKKPRLKDNAKSGVQCTLYEARALEQQGYDSNAIFEMQENLKKQNPNIPMVKAIRNSVSSDSWCETKFGKVPIFSPLAYHCSKLGNNFKVYINIDSKTPSNTATVDTYPDFPHRSIPQYYEHDISTLTSSERAVLGNIQITNEKAVELEQATQSQSQSSLWFKERSNRITASRVHDVFQWKRGMDSHAEKFANGDQAKLKSEFVQKKLDHGKMYESVALEKYKLCMKDVIPNTEVYPCGLVVNENNCWLGSSPDGKVISGDLLGIAECKCPEQYKNADLFDVASSNNSENFMLYVENSKLQVRKTHKAYYQIQCQLALTGSEFCDLIVYTFQSVSIVRITFNSHFWKNVTDVVGPRYFQYILPKL